MDWNAVVTTLGSTAIIIAALSFLAKSIVSHLLKRDLDIVCRRPMGRGCANQCLDGRRVHQRRRPAAEKYGSQPAPRQQRRFMGEI